VPELWQAETGEMRPAPAWKALPDGRVAVPLTFDPTQSWFVVLRQPQTSATPHLTDFTASVPPPHHAITVQRAIYVAVDGTGLTLDLTAKIGPRLEAGELIPRVDNALAGTDPSSLHVKQLRVEYTLDGKPAVAVIGENGRIRLPQFEPDDEHPGWDLALDNAGAPLLTAWKPGEYRFSLADGRTQTQPVTAVPTPLVLSGPWTVRFDPHWGGPAEPVTFDALTDWTQRPEPGIHYYSGTAVYTTDFDVTPEWLAPARPVCLDLGSLANLAEVAVNGHELGIVWKAPWRVDLRGVLMAGRNRLEVRATNNWANRLIGDKGLPAAQRVAYSTTNPYKWDSPLQASGLWGPVVVRAGVVVRPGL
jgi:hypothetical protein